MSSIIVLHLVLFSMAMFTGFLPPVTYTCDILVIYLCMFSQYVSFGENPERVLTVLFIRGGNKHVHNQTICSGKSAWVPADRDLLPGDRACTGGMRHDFYLYPRRWWGPSDHGCPILLHRHPGQPGRSDVARLAGSAESNQ